MQLRFNHYSSDLSVNQFYNLSFAVDTIAWLFSANSQSVIFPYNKPFCYNIRQQQKKIAFYGVPFNLKLDLQENTFNLIFGTRYNLKNIGVDFSQGIMAVISK